MENLIIIGAGGFALEVIDLIESINTTEEKYKIIGLLDDYKKDFILEKYNVIGKVADYKKFSQNSFVIAIADPNVRESIYSKLKLNDIKTPNLIHPKTEISKYTTLQADSAIVINYSTQISAEVKIEKAVIIDSKSYIGHETTLKSFVTIYPGVNISGKNLINEKTEIGLGSNIIQGLSIGSNSLIGAGSTVINDIKDNVVAVGTPCKPIKDR
ncbi:MAG: NeuD/PglB/VioB family sugar acetyltransferase [Tenericutes bacterium]|nr:NeuD/PglB/VioB family sugar acetyltransferase [Mycoplasmatota bacterium]